MLSDALVFKVANKHVRPVAIGHPFAVQDILPNPPFQESDYEPPPKLETPGGRVLGTSIDASVVWGGVGFVKAVANAYNEHHRLVIRPDDVWIAVATQLARHLNANAALLHRPLVEFQGKRELVVTLNGELENADYAEFCRQMGNEIRDSLKDRTLLELFQPNFSTTTPTDRAVGSAVLMAATQQYFDFVFQLKCGIPEIALLGTVEDWEEVLRRCATLSRFECPEKWMAKWSAMLVPVVQQFVNAKRTGNPDPGWWNRICHFVGGGSGPKYLSGWITVFCVFSEEGRWQADQTVFQDRWRKKKQTFDWCLIETDRIPRGYTVCPVTVVEPNNVRHACELYAGHMGVRVEPADTVVPQVGWVLFRPDSQPNWADMTRDSKDIHSDSQNHEPSEKGFNPLRT